MSNHKLPISEIEHIDNLVDRLRKAYNVNVADNSIDVFKQMKIEIYTLDSFDCTASNYGVITTDNPREDFKSDASENKVMSILYWNDSGYPKIFVQELSSVHDRIFYALRELGRLVYELIINGWKIGEPYIPLYKNCVSGYSYARSYD